jgi:hypothetical protein
VHFRLARSGEGAVKQPARESKRGKARQGIGKIASISDVLGRISSYLAL